MDEKDAENDVLKEMLAEMQPREQMDQKAASTVTMGR